MAPSSTSDRPTAHQLLELAKTIGDEAGELILDRVGGAHTIDTKASDLDLVTEVDRASEELIVGRILSARPEDGILGEEGSSVSGTSGVDWVIDPIDGTTSFVYGLPGFSVSIAVRVDGETVAGYVHAPVIGARYAASSGGGLRLDGRTTGCSDITELDKALIGTGFSPDHARRERQGLHFASFIPRVRDIRRMGSAALDLSAVATGQLDGYFEIGLSEWDWAAGELLVREGGGRVIVERDAASGRAFIAAASPGIADVFFAMLRELGADQV
ncbi:MAG: inositol monophosphatase family protein [Actinomycetota bacterium]